MNNWFAKLSTALRASKIKTAAVALGVTISALALAQFKVTEPVTLTVSRGGDVVMPLASVAPGVGWRISEDYRLVVLGNAPQQVTLDVYSPGINLNDYYFRRNRRVYLGDELYGKAATLQTLFKLSSADKKTTLAERRFANTRSHDWVRVYSGTLRPGIYPITVNSGGLGKNAFQFRTSNGARVEASQFVVNARGKFRQDQLVAFMPVGKNLVGKTLTLDNYDADGTRELVLTAVLPNGTRRILTPSEDAKWAQNAYTVTAQDVGTWRILARILPTTRQFSNSFGLRTSATFVIPEPLLVEVFDTQLKPIPGSDYTISGTNPRVIKPVLPKGWIPVSAEILRGTGKVDSKTQVSLASAGGHIRFIARRATSTIKTNAVAVVCGQRLPMPGTAFNIQGINKRYTAPSNIGIAPGTYKLIPGPLPGSATAEKTVTTRDGQTSNVTFEYTVTPEVNLTPDALNLEIGDTATLTATASTDFPIAVPANFTVSLPSGLEATGPVTAQGEIAAGKPLVLEVPVKATAVASNAEARVTLEPNCASDATKINISGKTDIALTKTVDKSEAEPGDEVNFTITVTNTGTVTAKDVELTDELPEGLTGAALEEKFDLAPNESKSFQLPAVVDENVTGSFVNTAVVTYNGQPLEASATVNVKGTPVIELTKTVDKEEVEPGDAVEFTITVLNTGNVTAKDVELIDVLPEGLTGDALAERFDLEPNEEKTFTLPATVDEGTQGEIVNTAQAILDDQTVEASAPVRVVANPVIEITKEVDQSEVSAGDTVNFTITVTNTGNATARGVELTDELPEGLSGDPLNETFDLEPGESQTFDLPAAVDEGVTGEIENVAIATLDGQEYPASATVNVKGKPAIAITKEVDKPEASPGDTVNFTITVTNTGNETAQDVTLQDALPTGLTGDVIEQTFTLEPGQSQTFELLATVDDDATGDLENIATATLDGESVDASATVTVVPLADLEIVKGVDPSEAKTGDTVTYTLAVVNNGPSTGTNVTVDDPLPEGLEYVSATASQGTVAFENGSVVAKLGTLENGASASIEVKARVTATTAGELPNVATVTGSEADPILENNTADAVLTIAQPKGTLNVKGAAVSCATTIPFDGGGFTLNGQAYKTPSSLSLEPGEYTLTPAAVPGATAQPVKVTVTSGGTSEATITYAVQSSVSLQPDSLILEAGQTDTLTAIASTDFPAAIPATITVTLPATLRAEEPVTQSGSIQAGQPLVLDVPVKALKKTDNGQVTAALDAKCEVPAAVSTLEIAPKPLPDQSRESQVTLLSRVSEVPASGYVVLSDRIPAGTTYVGGSSRWLKTPNLNAQAVPSNGEWFVGNDVMSEAIGDPLVSGDRLYWIVPASAIEGLTANNKPASEGCVGADATYGITYRLAHQDALVMPADRVGLVYALPPTPLAAQTASQTTLSRFAAGNPVPKLVPEGTQFRLLQGDPTVLEGFYKAQPYGGAAQAQAAPAVGGPAAMLKISLVRGTTDLYDQPVLVIDAFDVNGNPANDPFVTLEVDPEPATPDAAPDQYGYQARLVNGTAVVRLTNIGPSAGDHNGKPLVTAEARVSNGNGTVSSSTQFHASDLSAARLAPSENPTFGTVRPWLIVGAAGVGLNGTFGSTTSFSIDGSFKAFAKGTLFDDVLLTLGINFVADYNLTAGGLVTSGDLLPNSDPFLRFPLLGDSSLYGGDARSSDGIYVRLDKGPSYVMYGQINPGFRGLLTNYTPNFNGLQALVRAGGLSVNGFAAYLPNANLSFTRQGDGTSLYRLPNAPIVPSSERVVIIAFDKNNPSLRLETKPLARLADYEVDYYSGTIILRRALFSVDAGGNPQYIEVQYASESGAVARDWRLGAQAGFDTGNLSVTGTALLFNPGQTLFGVGAAFKTDALQFGAELASSSALGVGAQLALTNPGFQLNARYQDLQPGYIDPNSSSTVAGRALNLGLTFGNPQGFSITGRAAHNQDYTSQAGSNTASLEARNNFGPFTAALGILGQFKFGSSSGTDAWVTAGLQLPIGPLTFSAVQRVPVTRGTYGDTTLALDYAISPSFGIRIIDTLTYEFNGIRQQASFGVRGTFTNRELLRVALGNVPDTADAFGTTNIAASYDLDTIDGNAGRARVGLDTTIPLGNSLSVLLGAEALLPPGSSATAGLSAGLLYSADGLKASGRAQYNFSPAGTKQVYTFGAVAQLGSDFILSPALEYANGPIEGQGGRFSIAGAYRGDDWTILTNHIGKFGFYAPASGDVFEGEIRFGYEANERFFLRFGGAYRLGSAAGFVGQIGAGATWFFTDTLGLDLNAAYQFQPSVPASNLALGVGASLRLFDGFLLSAGLNFSGIQNAGPFITAPGFYIRFDWKFDERSFRLGR